MIFLHPNSPFFINSSNPITPNCKQKKTPLLNPIHSCSFQSKFGSFDQYKYIINKGGDCSVIMEYFRKMGIGCFGSGKVKQLQQIEEKVDAEPVAGGQDVIDAAMADAKLSPQHLVVMVNGLIGSATDWKFAADQFVKQLPDKVMVHCSQCNTAKLTFDGVDLMGERLADEVSTVISRRPELQKISFIAHSLGGLVARYAIGKLYEPLETSDPLVAKTNYVEEEHSNVTVERIGEDYKGRIAGLEPMNFVTVATPHLGSRGHRQPAKTGRNLEVLLRPVTDPIVVVLPEPLNSVGHPSTGLQRQPVLKKLPFLCGVLFLEKQASQTAHLIAGRSGKHLFLTDTDEGKPPLLVRMASDSYEYKFISALHSFKRRVAYANVNYDHVVGWSTSSIRRRHELPKANLLANDDKYPHIVYVERQTLDNFLRKASSYAENQTIDHEEEMIRGLNQVPWERVDVSFHRSRQRYIAHNTIQVKSYWLNSDGVDVIHHMINNFLV